MMFGARSLLAALVATAVFAGASATAGSAAPSAGASGAGPLSGFRSVLAQRTNSQDHVNSRRRFQMRACSSMPKGRFEGGGVYAAVLPGDSFTSEVVVGGILNFLSIYNILITGRVLLSWVPQLQGVEALQPVYMLTDPYLNAFRRLNLNFGGLDLSVLPAFLLLSFATNAVASLGAELPESMKGGGRWWADRKAEMSRRSHSFASSTAAAIAGPSSSSPQTDAPSASRRRLFSFHA